uniref:Amidase domain-containing protein n=1 Tax=Anisakis simplex TaxID=6269 RepID=A0A0M3KDT8_ANISI
LGHRSINRPESVLQLARKFAEASAVQNNKLFASTQKAAALFSEGTLLKSFSGPTTPVRRLVGGGTLQNNDTTTFKKPGGIACLKPGTGLSDSEDKFCIVQVPFSPVRQADTPG